MNYWRLITLKAQSNSVRFVRLRLKDYGIFCGSNEIEFNRHRTLIAGGNGTGKTIIAQALAHLGPVKGIKACSHSDRPEMSVEVVTEGNRNLVKKYSSVIFLDYKSAMRNKESMLTDVLSHQNLKIVKDEAREIFRMLLFLKPNKIREHQDMSPCIMALGEKICLGYAFAFAARKVLNIDVPAVIDAPYAILDLQLRKGLYSFLKKQSYQQILLGTEEEFTEEGKPHYILDAQKHYSRVIKAIFGDKK